MIDDSQTTDSRYGPRRLTVELTNICNLHCSYCLRDEDALYHQRAEFMPLDTLRSIVRAAREAAAIAEVNFTGGEPTLHPNFAEAIGVCGAEGLKTSFVTNGWNFDQLWPKLADHRGNLTHVAFSIDGTNAETHDRWRGDGSFVRLIRAFSRCQKYGLPFVVKTGIRRDTMEHLEEVALFAARLGASGLAFAHVMPTSDALESSVALSLNERRRAEEEIALLARIFKMKVTIDVGYYNIDKSSPCAPLADANFNVDYRGRLTLCCNLSGFRGATHEDDVVADLKVDDFAAGYVKLRQIGQVQLEKRHAALLALEESGTPADLYTGSPCLFCLKSFDKLPWKTTAPLPLSRGRSLPIVIVST